VRKNVS
jgi:hypothetical protein